jgi:3-phenylpropionate/trans-cinnamate dioxygenase ferredoxin reductase subunit
MNAIQDVVIVGAGHAGFSLASALADSAFKGRISLVNAEGGLPYQRPPLSKKYLSDGKHEDLYFQPKAFFESGGILLVQDAGVAIDRAAQTVATKSGNSIPYDALVLATGTSAIQISFPGDEGDVAYLDNLNAAIDLRRRLADVRRVAVIGAGFIGMEFASAAIGKSISVAVVDNASRPMERSTSQNVSMYFQNALLEAGVTFHFQASATAIRRRDGKVESIKLKCGTEVPADLVLLGIGTKPNVELALQAGLACSNGVIVDEFLATSDPHIFAIGDCAVFPAAGGKTHHRITSVQNASDQARYLAQRLLGREESPYRKVPWFWSDQGSNKLQIVGLPGQADSFVTWNSGATGKFSVFGYREGRLVSVESVNRPGDHALARKILERGISPDPKEVGSGDFDLRGLLDKTRQRQEMAFNY